MFGFVLLLWSLMFTHFQPLITLKINFSINGCFVPYVIANWPSLHIHSVTTNETYQMPRSIRLTGLSVKTVNKTILVSFGICDYLDRPLSCQDGNLRQHMKANQQVRV